MTPNNHRHKEKIFRKGYHTINCLDCGYWHVHPMPTIEELNQLYENEYYETMKNNPGMTDKTNDPDGIYTLQYEDRLRRINRLLNPELQKYVLDIGCGFGDFLKFMKSKKWKTAGIEPSKLACSQSLTRELSIHQSTFKNMDRLDIPPASVVTLNNVLEHVPNPGEILDQIKNRFLLPGGIITVHLPNDFSILHNIMMKTTLKNTPEKQNYWVGPPAHLNFWNTKTFKKFVESEGFKTIHITSTFPLEFFPLMGEDYILKPDLGRQMHLKRVNFEKNIAEAGHHDFKDSLCEHFAQMGIGRTFDCFIAVNE